MTIPGFQEFMRPVLQLLEDGRVHDSVSMRDQICSDLGISEDARTILLPSGRQSMFDNRFFWAVTYLRKTSLINTVARGHYQITERGIDALNTDERIDLRFLERYPELEEFRRRPLPGVKENHDSTAMQPVPTGATPEEALQVNYLALRNALANDLLERILSMPPSFFERLVIDVLVAMGYGGSREDAGRALGRTGDEGIDGIIDEDRLGLDRIYLQAKRWTNPVGSGTLRDFMGSLDIQGAQKGVIITTSTFTEDARATARKVPHKKIVLIDGQRLTELMMEFRVGIIEKERYIINRIDEDYFSGE